VLARSPKRVAQVERHEAAQKTGVLERQRRVEPERAVHAGDFVGRRFVPEDESRRVTWQQPQREEDERRQDAEHGQRFDEPPRERANDP
jgi:hypothetical protein